MSKSGCDCPPFKESIPGDFKMLMYLIMMVVIISEDSHIL